MTKTLTALSFIILFYTSKAQTSKAFADSIRIAYDMPELNYAVVSSDSIVEMFALGFKKVNSELKAELTDRFRIGSNTKTVTSYLAALLVKEGKIKWETKFFDLYPVLKLKSNPAYYNLTLQDLLTFRAKLIGWSYGNIAPTQNEIKGNEQEQRYEFVSWVFQQAPVTENKIFYFSNPAYVAAGLMLEKVTGKDYKELINELGKELMISFDFGQPNFKDSKQTWGHDEKLEPEEPADNYRLNWLSSAGNLNVSLPDYIKFIQLQLRGLKGQSEILTAHEFNLIHYGLPGFAFGWHWYIDENSKLKYSWHRGNPGTFLSKVYICKDIDRAFIFFTNVDSDKAEDGLTILFKELTSSIKSTH